MRPWLLHAIVTFESQASPEAQKGKEVVKSHRREPSYWGVKNWSPVPLLGDKPTVIGSLSAKPVNRSPLVRVLCGLRFGCVH